MTKAALARMIEGTKEERTFLAKESFGLFCIYYFSDYFKYALADYHYDFFQDCHDLVNNDIREVAWIAFRESGKTSIAKLFVIWLIATSKRRYINVDSFDKENAERILFDVAFEMTNNKRLQADFGVMFSKQRGIEDIKQNRINNFVTQNGIRVEAHSTQESVRGRLHLNQRPDCLICHSLGTKMFYKDKWISVEEHSSFKQSRTENGKEVKIHTLPFSEKVTNEHRYWVKNIPLERIKNTTLRKYKDIYTGWCEAKDLTKYHFIGTPIDYSVKNAFVELPKYIGSLEKEINKKGQIIKVKNGYKKQIPKEFYYKDWWFLFGLWWADGHLSGKYNNDATIGFTINSKDIIIIDKIKTILNESSIKFSVINKVGCIQIIFSNAVIGRWLRTWRTGNSIKQPPFWVEQIDIEKQKELIKGYIAGDGFVDLKNKEVRITSINLDGLLCVRRILARIGIPCSIRNGIDGSDDYMIMGVKCKTQKKYDLRFRQNASFLGYEIENQTRYRYTEAFIEDGYLWCKIQSIDDSGTQSFCPIKTDESKYITAYGLSHNCDDIETNKTKDSQAYTKQVADHISEAMAGMSPDGFMLYLGNFITEYGNINHLFERAKNDPGIRVRNIPVVIDGLPAWGAKYALTDVEAKETGKVSIEDKQRQLGSLVFSYEMMNKPIDEMLAEFKKEYAQFEVMEVVKKMDTRCYVTIDSAVSEKESADFTGITVNWVSSENKWYVKTYRLKCNSKELIDHLFYIKSTYNPMFMGLEETTFTMAIQPFLEEEMRKRNIFFSVTPVKHRGVNKEVRIRGLIPRWENRSIFLVGDNTELLDEMRVFPKGQHDDVLDSFAMMVSIAKAPFRKVYNRSEDDTEKNEAI